ncbi:hypothetical protein DFJ74DRAFT_367538 [Hyaloraphidium curvatum]|nr:hypothetical protein DFJ74DRAFT_367538 [Hyaloraphidium curvatum]
MEGTRRGKKVRLAGRQPNFTPHVPSTDAVPSADELVGQHDHFRHAPRFELRLDMTRDDVIKIVKENVMEKGLPIVLSNALEYFGWDPALADPQWLVDNCADIPASLRDVTSAEDYVAGTLSSVVDHLRNGTRPPGTPESSVLYAKDMTCPKQLEDHLRDILPPYLQYLGPHDFAHYLPEKLQPVNLMLYGGGDGTFTPGHYDIGGSLGHNLMLHTDPGAYALWFLFEANDKHKAEDIWRSQKASLHLDNYFCPIETLKQQGSRGVPILVLEQRKGDFVILPPDCAHQVLNVGGKNAGEEGEAKSPGFNLKISWNRTTADSLRVSYREVLPRYRAVLKPEIYRVSAQIYFATRTIAEKVYKWCKPFMLRDASSPSDGTRVSTSPPSDAPSPCLKDLLHWVESLSILLPLLTEMVRDELVANKHGDFPNMDCDAVDMWPEHQEDPHSRTCDFCRCDIWNRGWTCVICSPPGGEEDGSAGAGAEDGGGKDRATSPGGSERHFDLCSNCYMLGRSCAHPAQMQFKGYLLIFRLRKYLHRFHEIYNAALDELQRMAGEPGSDVILDEAVRLHPLPNPLDKLYNFVQELPIPSAATAAYSLHLSLQKPQPKMCHACKSAKTDWIACPHCETKLCSACLWNRFAEKIGECRRRGRTWKCPRCRDDCNCIACMRSRQASFAKYPVPEGVVILAGWFPHLDGVPGLAVHDVNYPKGPSYQNAPIEIGRRRVC